MLFFHENQSDEINLDKEPLLGKLKRNDFIIKEKIPIYVNECYFKYMINDFAMYDEQHEREENLFDDSINKNSKQFSNEILEPDENLCGLFVVSFDIRLGNVIEWQIPSDLNLEQIEFKAMASGLHLMQNDLVYFCKDDMFGLAVFGSVRVDKSEERNIRMKSVGIMAKSFKSLKKYAAFLKSQVQFHLGNQGNYDALIDLWNRKQLKDSIQNQDNHLNNQQTVTIPNVTSFIDKFFTRHSTIYKHLTSINQMDCKIYSKFVLYFGPSIFSLWKCVLLNKRILFHSAPPIGDLSYRVYCASQLGNTSFNFASSKQLIKPYFYVSVTDIDKLQQEAFYLACTTEKIFENKNYLYDIFVKDSSLSAVLIENQKSLLKLNSADRRRYNLLIKKLNILEIYKKSPTGTLQVDTSDDETAFLSFFTELNDKIFSTLFELENPDLNYFVDDRNKENFAMSSSNRFERNLSLSDRPKSISIDQIRKMGLDPIDDKDFLNELIHFYDFNLTLN